MATRNTTWHETPADQQPGSAATSRRYRTVARGVVITLVAAVFSLGQPSELAAAPKRGQGGGGQKAQKPWLSLSAASKTVAYHGSSALSWTAVDTTDCQASGAWAGSKGASGTETVGPLTTQSTYVLTCTGPGGKTKRSVKIGVESSDPAPTVSLSANPSSVAYDDTTTLTWSASGADSCNGSGSWSGSKPTSGSETIGSLTSSATFSLSCTGPGGSGSDSVNVAVAPPPAPTLSLTASPASVAYDGSTTLSWSASNVNSCAASGDWSGNKASSGNQTLSNLTSDRTYTLACTGTGGSVTRSASVAVAAPPTPTLSLTASPTSVAFDGSTTLSWSASNVYSCAASGDWSGNKAFSGNQTLSNLTSDQTYTLACTGTGGSVTRSASVTVAPPTPTLSLTASPASVAYDGSTTLSWSASNVDSCAASGDWSGNKASSGNQTLSNLTSDRTYTLACTGAGGSVTRSASVTVAAPGAPGVSLSASPSSVAYNGSTTLTWSTTDATSCSASGDWSGSKSTSGSETVNSLTADSSFTLSCSGPGGHSTRTANVSVGAAPTPTLALTASPASVAYDGSTTLSWSASNVNSCAASGDWSGNKASSGNQTLSNLTSDRAYTLACTGTGGSVTRSASVTVAPPTPTLSLTASPASVAYDGSTTLSWSASNVDSCAASGDWSGNKASSGNQTLSNLTSDQTYTLSCTGAGGSATRSTTVTVAAPSAPTVSLSASPGSVAYNGSTSLTWSATNATACTATGDWSGSKTVSGSQTISSLTEDSSFMLTCIGAGGSDAQSTTVTVIVPSAPTVSLSASPSSVAYNGSTSLTWSATNATACTATGDWSGSKTVSGSQTIGSLTDDSSFTLSCSGPGGNASDSVSVTVDSTPIANEDVAQTSQGTPVDVNVLTNDTGIDDLPLTLTVMSAPSNGTASANSGSIIRYTSTAPFAGQDSLNYRVADADGDSATANVRITVTCDGCAAGTTLVLSWDPNPASEGVTGYKVFHGLTASTASTEVTDVSVAASGFDANAPSREYDAWNDLELNTGDQVCFRLKAYNSAGTSDFSSAACTVL